MKTGSCIRLIALCGAMAAAPLAAQTVKPQAKAIRALPGEQPLKLSVSPARPQFRVQEPIALKIDLGRSAYVYVYNRGNDGQSQFVYPALNAGETKLPAGKQTLRSGAADTPGSEELVVFASERPLNLIDEQSAEQGMPTREFEARLADAGVRVGANARAAQLADVSLPQSVTLTIAGATAGATASNGVALVATDKSSYKVGDPLQLVFGTNKPGYVELFVRYPQGKIEPLLSHKFDAPGVVTRAATAEVPSGEQTILAVYSTDGKVSPRMLSDAGVADGDATGKAIRLRDVSGKPDLNISSRAIRVEE